MLIWIARFVYHIQRHKMIRMKQKIRPKKWNEKETFKWNTKLKGKQIYVVFFFSALLFEEFVFFSLHFRLLLSVFTEYLRILCKRPYPPCNQFYLIWYSFYISFPTTASHPFLHKLPFESHSVFTFNFQKLLHKIYISAHIRQQCDCRQQRWRKKEASERMSHLNVSLNK